MRLTAPKNTHNETTMPTLNINGKNQAVDVPDTTSILGPCVTRWA